MITGVWFMPRGHCRPEINAPAARQERPGAEEAAAGRIPGLGAEQEKQGGRCREETERGSRDNLRQQFIPDGGIAKTKPAQIRAGGFLQVLRRAAVRLRQSSG